MALIDVPPTGVAGHRHFDHRRRYLTCEGDLSNGRGTVRIVQRATVRLRAATFPDPQDGDHARGAVVPPAVVSTAWRLLGLGTRVDWTVPHSLCAARAASGYPAAYEVTGIADTAAPFSGWLVTGLPRAPDPVAPNDFAREFTPWAYVPHEGSLA